jgi:glutathione S-transferase
VIDNYAYRALVWEIYVPQWWRGGMAPSAQALTAGEHALASLDRLMTQAFRISPPTLGWCYLVSMLAAADSVTAGSDLIDRVPTLRAWWNVARTSHLLTNTRSDQTLY